MKKQQYTLQPFNTYSSEYQGIDSADELYVLIDSEGYAPTGEAHTLEYWFESDYLITNLSDFTEDMFQDYDNIPEDVKTIVDEFAHEDMSYEDCAQLVKALNAIGYTCDYYLDADPFDLRKMSKAELAQTNKLFACVWGSWEEGMNSYQPSADVRGIEEFTHELGYEDEDISNINALEIGEQHNASYGNHFIFRLQ